jgi:hypothetical protein
MFFLIFIGNYHWLTTSEKALKCQRRVTESDSQPEPHPVGQQNVYAPIISKQSKGTPDNPFPVLLPDEVFSRSRLEISDEPSGCRKARVGMNA